MSTQQIALKFRIQGIKRTRKKPPIQKFQAWRFKKKFGYFAIQSTLWFWQSIRHGFTSNPSGVFCLFGVVVRAKNCLSHFQTKSIIFCLFFTISPWFGHKSHLTWASVRPTSDKTSVFFFHAEVTSTKVRQKQNFVWSTTIPLNFYFMLCPNCNSFIMDLNCRN